MRSPRAHIVCQCLGASRARSTIRTFYDNLGYTLLAEVVERVSGKPLATFADERILQPLGTSDTHFHDRFVSGPWTVTFTDASSGGVDGLTITARRLRAPTFA